MKRKSAFTLIELMVVVAIIAILGAVLTPQVTNGIYKARVAATAITLKNFKMALDMLINDIGLKPPHYGGAEPTNDQLALIKRTSCPSAYQSLWNGPYIHNYPTSMVSSLFYYPDTFWYYYSWPGTDSGVNADWCGTGHGILLHTRLISLQTRIDVENALLGKRNPYGDSWLYWCGFHDNRQTSTW